MPSAKKTVLSRLVGLGTALVVVCGLTAVAPRATAAPAPVEQPGAQAMTADRLPTVQIDGVVWSQAVVGNTVYAGGRFGNARPAGAAAGTNLTPRGNLLAYDITTGNLITSFAPSLNGQVLGVAASPDGTRVYVVGDFTTANGQARRRVAAYSTATGALISTFNPSGPNSQARSVVATNDTVYVGGGFLGLANGTLRNNLVAYRASDGAVLPWNPSATGTAADASAAVWALTISADGASVFAGGQFQNVGGQPAYGLAKVAGSGTGPLDTTWRPSVRNAGKDAGISSLRVQNGFVYGTSWHFGPGGNLEGTFKAPTDGASDSTDVAWVTDCHGDVYSSFVSTGIVYTAGHAHYCGNMGGGFPQYSAWKFQHAQAWSDTQTGDILNDVHGYPNWHLGTPPAGVEPAPAMVNWLPDMAIGSFTGQYQAGWTVAGTSNGDYLAYGGEFPRVNGVAQQGLARFAKRSLAGTPKAEGPRFDATPFVPTLIPASTTAVRVSWPAGYDRDDRTLTYRAYRTGVATPRHQVDANSQWWNLPQLGFTDTGLTPGTTYTYRIVANDPAGNTVNGSSVSVTMPTSFGAANAYATTVRTNGARIYWPLNETSGTTVTDRAAVAGSPANVGVTDGRADTGVTWNQPGAIPGNPAASLGNNDFSRVFAGNCAATAGCQWGTETAPDTFTSQVWIRTTTTSGGRILGFGDLQNGNSGHRDRHLYMDNTGRIIFGVKAQNNSLRTVTSPLTYRDGQWHMLTATMSSTGMRLYVDGVQVSSRTDTTAGEAYLGYWRLGGDNLGGWPSAPSTANFIGGVDEVAIYPTALTAAQISAQYAARNGGAVPNQAPTASFSHTTSGLIASFDAGGSSDPDGTIVGYSWSFGDGSSGTGTTPTRTYAAAGTYSVTLTVTDDDGATNAQTRSVSVAPQPAGAIATDTFGRAVTDGWGSADTGGPWTLTTSATNFSVAGGEGRVQMAAGSGPSAYLADVAARDVDVLTTLGYDKPATGGGVYTSVVVRRGSGSDYRAKLQVGATGTTIHLARTLNGTETLLSSTAIPGLVVGPTVPVKVRLRAQGNGTTTLSVKVWRADATEPAAWTSTATDSTPTLQTPGSVGFYSYLSGSATNAPITLAIPDVQVTSP